MCQEDNTTDFREYPPLLDDIGDEFCLQDEECGCDCEESRENYVKEDYEKAQLNLYKEFGTPEEIEECFLLMESMIKSHRAYKEIGTPQSIQQVFRRILGIMAQLREHRDLGCIEYLKYLTKREACRQLNRDCLKCGQ